MDNTETMAIGTMIVIVMYMWREYQIQKEKEKNLAIYVKLKEILKETCDKLAKAECDLRTERLDFAIKMSRIAADRAKQVSEDIKQVNQAKQIKHLKLIK